MFFFGSALLHMYKEDNFDLKVSETDVAPGSVSLITPGHPRIPQDTPGQHYLYVQYII